MNKNLKKAIINFLIPILFIIPLLFLDINFSKNEMIDKSDFSKENSVTPTDSDKINNELLNEELNNSNYAVEKYDIISNEIQNNNSIIEEKNTNAKKPILNTELNPTKDDIKPINEHINSIIEVSTSNDKVIKEEIKSKEVIFTITKSSENLTNKDVVITVNTDNDNLVSFNNETYSLSKIVKISKNINDYSIKVKNNDGIVKEEKISITNIDKVLPTLNYTQNIKDKTKENVIVTLSSSDNISLPDQRYSYNYGEFIKSNTYTFTENVSNFSIRVIDNAGNISEKFIAITNIDKEKTVKEKNNDLINEIKSIYGFDIEYGSETYFWFNGESCTLLTDEDKVYIALNSLQKNLSLFPEGFFYMFQGKNGYSVLLVDDIPGEVAGVATSEMPGSNQLVIDVNTGFLGRTFFHETFHLIDYLFDYMYDDRSNHPFKDWNNLNANEFSYSGLDYDDNSFTIYDSSISNSEKRFISSYSKKNEREDRAELFADLMFRPYKKEYMYEGYGIYEKAKYLVSVLNKIWTNNSKAGWNRWIN